MAEREFLSAIADDIANPDPYLVYADWLQRQGHLRGELISVQHALEHGGAQRLQLLRRNAELIDDETLWPKLPAELRDRYFFSGERNPPCHEADWRYGFVRRLWIQTAEASAYPRNTCDGRAFTRLLLSHPSCRFLERLEIGAEVTAEKALITEPLIEEVVASDLDHLRALTVGRFFYTNTGLDEEGRTGRLSWPMLPPLALLLASFPRLRELCVIGQAASLAELSHARLESLELRVVGLTAAQVRNLWDADLPALHTLNLWLGSAIGPDDLAPLLQGDVFGGLKHLGLKNVGRSSALARELASAPIVERLESLDLSGGTFQGHDLATLRKGARALSHVRRLVLDCNFLGDQRMELWSRLAGEVSARFQDIGETPRVLVPDRLERSAWGGMSSVIRSRTPGEPSAAELEENARWGVYVTRLSDNHALLLMFLGAAAQWCAEQGKVADAVEMLREHQRVAQIMDAEYPRLTHLISLGELLLDLGEIDEAQYRLEEALDGLSRVSDARRMEMKTPACILGDLALAELLRGDTEAAVSRLGEARRRLTAAKSGRGSGEWQYVGGHEYIDVIGALVFWQCGDTQRALTLLQEVAPELPRRFRQADIHYSTKYLLGSRVDAWIAALRASEGIRTDVGVLISRATKAIKEGEDDLGRQQLEVCRAFVRLAGDHGDPEDRHQRARDAVRAGKRATSAEARILAGLLARHLDSGAQGGLE